MKNKKINGELKELINEKGGLCTSIIVPLHPNPSDQQPDSIVIDHAIEKARILLNSKCKPAFADKILKKVKTLGNKINFSNGSAGVGIFVSENIASLVEFPFPVTEKIVVGNSFETRDVLCKELSAKDYFVLSLSRDEVRLFKGKGSSLKEVKNRNFPVIYTDAYEYSKPSRGNSFGNSLKGFEKDKSIVNELRQQSFYHTLDKKLGVFLNTHIPLVVAGVKKDIGYFEKITKHKNNIIGHVLGSYNQHLTDKFSLRVWEIIKKNIYQEQKKIVSSVRELTGNGLISTGIRKVWQDAKAGKGHTLVVEKDLAKPAFLGKDEFRLLLRPPQGKHQTLTDAVDDVIETVIEKNGNVVFVENGQLEDFENVALIKRY